jgi:serine/threonine protein kinase
LLGLLLAFAISASLAHHRRKRRAGRAAAQRAREQVRQLGRYELISPLGLGRHGRGLPRAAHAAGARRGPQADQVARASRAARRARRRGRARGGAAQRFFDEAQRLASLHSLHTVTVHDFGVAEDGRYFLVMELLDGLDLASLVAYEGPQPAARVAAILAQVCDSLAEAHEAGLVHQDIKPANVFLCRIADALDFVKVLDFGLARAVGQTGVRRDRRTPSRARRPTWRPSRSWGSPSAPRWTSMRSAVSASSCSRASLPTRARTARRSIAQHVHGPLPTLPGRRGRAHPAHAGAGAHALPGQAPREPPPVGARARAGAAQDRGRARGRVERRRP